MVGCVHEGSQLKRHPKLKLSDFKTVATELFDLSEVISFTFVSAFLLHVSFIILVHFLTILDDSNDFVCDSHFLTYPDEIIHLFSPFGTNVY